MAVRSSRHQALVQELAEWWEDISETRIGSRVVLVEVPPRWGVTTVLKEFGAMVADPDAPVAISVSVDAVPLAGRAVEAKALSDALLAALDRSRLAQLFGLHTAAGNVGLALGVGSLHECASTAFQWGRKYLKLARGRATRSKLDRFLEGDSAVVISDL